MDRVYAWLDGAHASRLLARGGRDGRSGRAARRRAQRGHGRGGWWLYGDVGGLAREGPRARGARGPARGGRALRPRAERTQWRVLQLDVALAAEHAGALGRRGGAG